VKVVAAVSPFASPRMERAGVDLAPFLEEQVSPPERNDFVPPSRRINRFKKMRRLRTLFWPRGLVKTGAQRRFDKKTTPLCILAATA
jgi:hypothetical protein